MDEFRSEWEDVDDGLTHRFLDIRGIRLHAVEAGPEDGPLVLLLHGFPEFWYGWRRQLRPLADAGFRVLAVDQRGYNLSDKPQYIRDYALDRLAEDVVEIVRASGRERAHLVGHDWGGVVAWWVALRHPEIVDRLVILNAPHPIVMYRALRSDFGQMRKSWYILMFRLPWWPEWALARKNDRGLIRAMVESSRPGTFSDEDFVHYRDAWSHPIALRSMIHWYRAAMRYRPERPADPRIRVLTLILWGERDRFLDRSLASASVELCDEGRLEVRPDATHWIQHEEPNFVNERIVRFLRGDP